MSEGGEKGSRQRKRWVERYKEALKNTDRYRAK